MTASSDERIDHIASIVVDGISQRYAEVVERQYLLELLAQLNDVQLLILVASGLSTPVRDDFWREHQSSLYYPLITRFSAQDDIRRTAVHEGYIAHLVKIGLLAEAGRELTELGRVLLHSIGHLQQYPSEIDANYESQQRDGGEQCSCVLRESAPRPHFKSR
jgi:hypothetical protein